MKVIVVTNHFKWAYTNTWEAEERDIPVYADNPVETFFAPMSVLMYEPKRQKRRLRDNGRYIVLSEYEDNGIHKQVRVLYENDISDYSSDSYIHIMIYRKDRDVYTAVRTDNNPIICAYDKDNEEYVSMNDGQLTYYKTLLDRQLKQNKTIIILKSTLSSGIVQGYLDESRQLTIPGF